MIGRICLLVAIGPMLGGCLQTFGGGSVAGGESRVFEAPKYVVKGKAKYDQNWIDSQIEGGVAAFGWKRPVARPASFDAPVRSKHGAVKKKKPGVIARIKAKVTGQPIEPVPYLDAPQPAPVVVKPAPKREAVDELLGIDGQK